MTKKPEPLTWHTEKRKVSELIPFEHNPRKMTEDQVAQLKTSLEKFGLVEIPVVDTDNTLIAGHQRTKTMILLGKGDEEIDVRVPNRKLTDKEFKEYNVRSNKNTGMWDDELLASLFDEQELRDIGFSDLELGMFDFEDKKEVEQDDVPETPVEPQSKLGDLYELPGGHRVLCGDSTSAEDVIRLMDGAKADLVFTDPPYNVDYSGSGKNTKEGILNDKMSKEDFTRFLHEVFQRYAESSKETAAWYVFHSQKTQDQFKNEIETTKWKVASQIIWNKPSAGMGMNAYRQKHEPMYYCETDKTLFYGDRTGTTVWDFHKELEDLVKFAKKLQRDNLDGNNSVWTMKREPVGEYVHPTQKPVELIERAIINSSKPGQLVLDLFLGSGATLIASGKKGRICYGMELDPKFVDVIITRYCNYVGSNQIIKNGKEITWIA